MWSRWRIGASQKGSRQRPPSRTRTRWPSDPVETAAAGVGADQTAGGGGEQPPPPAAALVSAEDVVDDLGRDRAVPGDLGGPARVGVDQRIDRQHDADLDVDVFGAGLSGDAFDEGVGHDLVARAGVARGDDGVGVLAQRGQARHALLDRQEAAEHAHRVWSRTQTDPAVLPRGAAPRHVRGAIGLVGQPAHHRGRPPQATARSISAAQICSSTRRRCSASRWRVSDTTVAAISSLIRPAANRSRTPGRSKCRARAMPRRREPWKGDIAAGQPDLIADPAPDRGRVEPVVGDLRLDLRAGERDHLRLLGRGERAAHPLERGDPVDPIGVGARRRIDGELTEAGQDAATSATTGSTAPPASSDRMFESSHPAPTILPRSPPGELVHPASITIWSRRRSSASSPPRCDHTTSTATK